MFLTWLATKLSVLTESVFLIYILYFISTMQIFRTENSFLRIICFFMGTQSVNLDHAILRNTR